MAEIIREQGYFRIGTVASGVQELAQVSDPAGLEVIYWVGCMSSFDARNQRVARALAKIFKSANVSFAILGKEESCSGDPARRAGNEYLYQAFR